MVMFSLLLDKKGKQRQENAGHLILNVFNYQYIFLKNCLLVLTYSCFSSTFYWYVIQPPSPSSTEYFLGFPGNSVMSVFLHSRHYFTINTAQLLKTRLKLILKSSKTVQSCAKGRKSPRWEKKKKKRALGVCLQVCICCQTRAAAFARPAEGGKKPILSTKSSIWLGVKQCFVGRPSRDTQTHCTWLQ